MLLFENKDVVLMHGLKKDCALLFFKGALLKDRNGLLFQQMRNVQAERESGFPNTQQTVPLCPILKAYIKEAVGLEKARVKVRYAEISEYAVPGEFQKRLDEDPDLKEAFEALTPGRQRELLLHSSRAEQSKARESRTQKILDGEVLKDR